MRAGGGWIKNNEERVGDQERKERQASSGSEISKVMESVELGKKGDRQSSGLIGLLVCARVPASAVPPAAVSAPRKRQAASGNGRSSEAKSDHLNAMDAR